MTQASGDSEAEQFDLVLIGTGSGNTVLDDRFAGRTVAIVEQRTFGGTCLNRGCIPSKMLIYPADLLQSARESGRLGLEMTGRVPSWAAIRDRVFGRTDEVSTDGRDGRRDEDDVTVFEGESRFVGDRTLEVRTGDGSRHRISGRQVVIAAGSRPVVPDLEGLDQLRSPWDPPPGAPDDPDHDRPADWYTSDDVMRMEELPRRLGILGGGYIGAELAHVFDAFGCEVVQIDTAPTLLTSQDPDVAEMFTRFARGRWEVRTETDLRGVGRHEDGGVALRLAPHDDDDAAEEVVVVDRLLLAAGRVPNGDRLDLERSGIEVDDDGLVVVDAHLRTTNDGVWALGDVCSTTPLKHAANHDARVVQHNLLHPDDLVDVDHGWVPNAVFSSPQIAAVGLTEPEARERYGDLAVIQQDFADVAYGWAMEDGELGVENGEELHHFVKLIADRESGRLVGAHLIGPHSSMLVQPFVDLAVSGDTVRGRARRTWWIHPALTEVVEQALLALESELDE